MKQPSLLAASIVASLACGQAAYAAGEGRILEIHNPGAIAEANAVKTAIDAVADTAATCRRTTSKTPLECECSARSEMARLRSAYDAAVADHPDWPGPDTTVWWSGTGLNFSAIKRAVHTCPED
jgi:hypothetical protein